MSCKHFFACLVFRVSRTVLLCFDSPLLLDIFIDETIFENFLTILQCLLLLHLHHLHLYLGNFMQLQLRFFFLSLHRAVLLIEIVLFIVIDCRLDQLLNLANFLLICFDFGFVDMPFVFNQDFLLINGSDTLVLRRLPSSPSQFSFEEKLDSTKECG